MAAKLNHGWTPMDTDKMRRQQRNAEHRLGALEFTL
jgi:hypothetical protein